MNPELLTTTVTVNGDTLQLRHEPGDSLLTALRSNGIVGPKRSCEAGDCGCCTVWLDNSAIQSCIIPAWRASGRLVTTIEGLSPMHPMQAAFLEQEGFQCGYCTAGMIMTLADPEGVAGASLRERTKGNICRCTGWKSIERAVAGAEDREVTTTDEAANHQAQTTPLGTPDRADSSSLMEPPGVVGETIPNRHGPAVVTGTPSFTADFLPEMPVDTAYVAAVRSPHAHAVVRAVDATEARALPGVIDIFWHEHAPRIPYTTACHPAEPRDAFDTYLLDNRVRFVGQRVAIVVAETVQIARRAAKLVRVQYETAPAVLEPREALQEGAPVVHPEPESRQIGDPGRNLIGEIAYTRGNPNKALAEADATVELTFQTPRQQHTHMEPHAATAWVERDGTLVVRASTQVPYLARRTLARILERPEKSIRVCKPRVGGGFGNKQEVLCEDIVAFAALRLGRPVHWEFNRWEEFVATNSRHPMELTVRAGATRDGELTALSLDFLSNGGAYGNHSYDVLECGAFESLSLYEAPNKESRGRAVYTNTLPAGAFRGYGAAQTTFAVDSALDELARRLGVDPLTFRSTNLVTPSSPLYLETEADRDHQVGSYALDQCVEYVRERIDEVEGKAPPSPNELEQWRYGRGFAVSTIGSGLASIHISGAVVELTRHGFSLATSTADIGTASDTTLAQIAAETLSVAYDKVFVTTGDTAAAPEDSGAYASATIYIAGKAVHLAATRLKERIIAAAAATLHRPAAELAVAAGGVVEAIPGAGRILLTWEELIDAAEAHGIILQGKVENFSHERVSMSFAAVGVRLRVNRTTGKVELLNLFQGIDAGTLINPRVALGQAEGATVQSLGYALSEELLVDAHGNVANPAFRDYRVPSVGEIGEIETRFFGAGDSGGPFGAKALGELTTTAVPAAVANGVSDALGVRMTELPLTPERCLEAAKESKSNSADRQPTY